MPSPVGHQISSPLLHVELARGRQAGFRRSRTGKVWRPPWEVVVSESTLRYLDLPVVDEALRVSTVGSFRTDRRRWLQLSLATIWVIDGLLQFQSFMFTRAFATQVLVPTAQGNPVWISNSILWAAHVVEANPVWTNGVFATLQLLIGLAIASRRLVKPALVVSIGWSLVVWWFGEGLGGLLLPGSSAFGGAPGAVLLYAVLAVLLWPTIRSDRGTFVAARPVGATAAKVVWVALWGGLALLSVTPANLTADSVHAMVAGMGSGYPSGWVH